MLILSLVISALSLVAKFAFGIDELTPDMIAVAIITPVVAGLSLLPFIGGNSWAKAVLAIAIGCVIAGKQCEGALAMCLIQGFANGLMAAGFWSVGKAATGK